jgi:hypothetical protein
MAYPASVKAETKRLVVRQGYTPGQASAHFEGQPAESTIDRWARTQTNEKGETWYQERDRLAEERYRVASPQHQASVILQKIQEVLSRPGFDANRADQLSKLRGFLRDFVDSDYHLAMTFQALHAFTAHLREHYPEVLEGDYVRALRDFKAQERRKIEG